MMMDSSSYNVQNEQTVVRCGRASSKDCDVIILIRNEERSNNICIVIAGIIHRIDSRKKFKY